MEDKLFWLEEYKNIIGQFQKFVDLYVKAFILYMGTMGVLIKFAFDSSSTPELKFVIPLFAILICIFLFLSIFFAEIMIRKMRKKRNYSLSKLDLFTEDEFVGAHWASIIFGIFNIFVIIGWILLLIYFPQNK